MLLATFLVTVSLFSSPVHVKGNVLKDPPNYMLSCGPQETYTCCCRYKRNHRHTKLRCARVRCEGCVRHTMATPIDVILARKG
jgi:hypothetical protein